MSIVGRRRVKVKREEEQIGKKEEVEMTKRGKNPLPLPREITDHVAPVSMRRF